MKTTLNFSIKSISIQLRMVVLASAFLLSGILFNAFAQTPAFYNSSAGTTYNAFPINSTTSNKVQWLYGPSLFNSAGSSGTPATSGVISKVYFRLGTTVSSTSSYSDYTISLGQNVGTTTAWSSGTFTRA